MQRRRIILVMSVALGLGVALSLSGIVALAETTNANVPTVTLEVPIGSTVQVNGLAEYVSVFYRFAVSAVSIVAATMIMYAGVSWLTAAGNTQRIGEAKERIIAAISGLILTMMSFVILNTINPQLVELENPSIAVSIVPESISNVFSSTPSSSGTSGSSSGSSGSTAGACPAASDWVNIYDTLNASNATAASLYQANHASSNLGQATPEVVSHLQTAILSAQTLGMTLYVNGDSRTYATQQRLYDCYTKSKTLPNWNKGENCVAECGSQCNLAAKPNCEGAPHLKGVALDLAWYPTTGSYVTLKGYAKGSCNNGGCVSGSAATSMAASQTALQTMMKTVGFKRICAEWWHFEFNGISTVLCEPGKY